MDDEHFRFSGVSLICGIFERSLVSFLASLFSVERGIAAFGS
jgi:hypothetical protein